MSTQTLLQKKSTSTNTPTQDNQFEGRGFAVQNKSYTHKSDLNTQLKQVDRYGHKLSKEHFPDVADTTVVQSKMGLNKPLQFALPKIPETSKGSLMSELAQENPNLNKPLPTAPAQQVPFSKDSSKKNIGKGAKTADLGSAISSTFSDTAKYVNQDVSGGMGGVLKLGAVATDAHDTYTSVKEGNKLNAITSGTKALAGGTESGANIAKFAGSAVDSVGVGFAGGIAGTVTGLVDTSKGARNIYQSRKGYRNIKGVARDTAEKIEPSPSGSKPRSTKELTRVQQTVPQKIQDKQSEIGGINTQIKDKGQQLRKATQHTDKDSLQQEIQGLKQTKSPLWRERNELQKQGDILQVAQYGANTQSKTTKREGINTVSGVGQIVGGSLAIAGVPAVGIGAVPGAATGMAAASIKPGAWGVRRGKQLGRDKRFPGFNQEKTSDKKNNERAEIADKLAARTKDPQMQTVFENLPGVSQEEIAAFKDNQMSESQVSKILKRRNY